ncbi:hypothetical protein [Acinetobacter guerrae]|uniref:hypothetical protein n=1 Tax=Acinetobacter guerrae TaxID=1843371 RepID=UPI00125F9994|nr:hypothetical protein [Acinetobacter guerrae]
MKRLLVASIFLLSCIKIYAQNEDCDYKGLSGQEYKISEDYKDYVTNSFEAYSDKEDWQQGDKSEYVSLRNNNFKVMETGVRTLSAEQAMRPFLDSYRYTYIYDKSRAFVADKSYRTKVLTDDCKIFYYEPSSKFVDFLDQIEFSNGKKLSFEDFRKFLGKAIFVKKIKTYSSYDKFEKRTTIRTEQYDDYLLRGYYAPQQKKLVFIQLYTDQVFFDNWAQISIAKDAFGGTHKVTRINGDADCSGSYGCRLTETIGIDISEQFLRSHMDGFELKLIGKKSRVINVSGEVIQSFLQELKNIRNQ